jgi:hypothetical protein
VWRESLSNNEAALISTVSLPHRQHLLLVSRLAVRLTERARSGGQHLLLAPGHVLHFSGDDFRYVLGFEDYDTDLAGTIPYLPKG